MSHHHGSDSGKLSPKRDVCSKGHAKSNSSHQSHNPKDMYNCHGDSINVGDFDYLWKMFPFTFCDASDHIVVYCEQRKVMVKRMEQILGTRHEEPLLVMKTSFSIGKRKHFCTHCNMNGH